MSEIRPGVFVRWRDPAPGAKPLGVVLEPLTRELGYVLVADPEGDTDLEVFAARFEATGIDAASLIAEHFEPAVDPNPVLATYLMVEALRREEQDR